MRVHAASKKISFPVTWHRSVLDLGRSLGDRHRSYDLALATSSVFAVSWLTLRMLSPQVTYKLLPKSTTSLNIKRAIDRLVRNMHRRIVGIAHSKPG
jgi:hypothetical protein